MSAALESARQEITTLRAQIGRLETRTEQYVTEISDVREQLRRTDVDRSELATQIPRLKDQVMARDISIGQLQAEIAKGKGAVTKLEAHVASLERNLTAEKQAVAASKLEFERATEEITALKSDVAKLIDERDGFSRNKDETLRHVDRLKADLASRTEELADVRARVFALDALGVDKDREIKSLTASLDDIRRGSELSEKSQSRRLAELETQLATVVPLLEQKIRAAEDLAAQYKKRIEALEMSQVDFDEETSQFKKAKEFLMAEVEQLSFEVERLTKELRTKEDSLQATRQISNASSMRMEAELMERMQGKERELDLIRREVEAEARLATGELLGRIAMLESDNEDKGRQIRVLQEALKQAKAATAGPQPRTDDGATTSAAAAAAPAPATGKLPLATATALSRRSTVDRKVLGGASFSSSMSNRSLLPRSDTFRTAQARMDVRASDVEMDYERLRELEAAFAELQEDVRKKDRMIEDLMLLKANWENAKFETTRTGSRPPTADEGESALSFRGPAKVSGSELSMPLVERPSEEAEGLSLVGSG